jgi:excisionase family DNA binding protein
VGEDRTGQPGPTNQRVTVPEAAELLGITAEAVRMRIKRGTLRSERQGGRVFVLLGQGQPTEQPTDRPDEPNALISQMQGRIDSLERQLEEAAERDRENRRIIVALTSRIPAIEAPASPEATESPETAREPAEGAEPHPDAPGAQEGVQRPWWRRWFGN